jgi:hypothetical protein
VRAAASLTAARRGAALAVFTTAFDQHIRESKVEAAIKEVIRRPVSDKVLLWR